MDKGFENMALGLLGRDGVTSRDSSNKEEIRGMTKDSRKVVIIEPGIVKAIDGKEYYNDQRIIAGSPDDVEAYSQTLHRKPADEDVPGMAQSLGKCQWCNKALDRIDKVWHCIARLDHYLVCDDCHEKAIIH